VPGAPEGDSVIVHTAAPDQSALLARRGRVPTKTQGLPEDFRRNQADL
jgi:hypothetical protein